MNARVDSIRNSVTASEIVDCPVPVIAFAAGVGGPCSDLVAEVSLRLGVESCIVLISMGVEGGAFRDRKLCKVARRRVVLSVADVALCFIDFDIRNLTGGTVTQLPLGSYNILD